MIGNLYVIFIFTIISATIISIFAPVNNSNLQLEKEEHVKAKGLVNITLLAEVLLAGIMVFINKTIYYCLGIAIISCAILIIISKILGRGGDTYEQC
jgi:accessory gene regulator protein AgrB